MRDPETVPSPEWKRNPATVAPLRSIKDFERLANKYFQECDDYKERPTITGLALAVNLPGPTTLLRLGQRMPELRYSLSRCITAISHEYEQMIGAGQATGPMFMLKNLPDFDPEEPEGEPAALFFNDRKEIMLAVDVVGAATAGDDFGDTDPLDVYLSVIRNPSRKATSTKSMMEKGDKPERPARPRMFCIIDSADAEEEAPEPLALDVQPRPSIEIKL